MLNLKIISAENLPPGRLYAKIYPQNFGQRSEIYNSTTDKSKKTSNPEWNHEMIIPFYGFQSAIIEFYNRKELVGITEIPFTISTFNCSQPQKIAIRNTKTGSAYCTFSLTMSNCSLSTQRNLFPINIFIYLTYSPPLQLNQGEVQLFVKRNTQSDQLVNVIDFPYAKADLESVRIGPTGPTPVYYLEKHDQTLGFTENYFFYIKSNGYTGNVTINFAVSDYCNKKSEKFYQLDSKSTVSVNCTNKSFVSFAIFNLLFKIMDRGVHSFSVLIWPQNLNVQNVPIKSQSEIDSEKRIIECGKFNLCTVASEAMHKKSVNDSIELSRKNKLFVGNRYSITAYLKNCGIKNMPNKIVIALGGVFPFMLDFRALTSFESGERIESESLSLNHGDLNSRIYELSAYNFVEEFRCDAKPFCFNLSKFESSIKYIGIFITCNMKKKQKLSGVSDGNMIINGYCRVADLETKKEMMYFDLPSHKYPASILTVLLVRQNNDWEIWPCAKYYEPKNAFITEPFKDADIKNIFENFMHNEIHQIFKV